MTIKEIISELIHSGNEVSYYKRKDGSYRITRINGKSYRGSTGNTRARQIIGTRANISELRARALSKLITPKGKGSYNKRRKQWLEDETIKVIRRIQQSYRIAGKKEGKPTIRNYRYILQTKGKAEADRLLAQSWRRIQGYAYVENVDALLLRISSNLSKDSSSKMRAAYNKIEELKYQFKDKWISTIYEIIYDWERRLITGDEAGERILAII